MLDLQNIQYTRRGVIYRFRAQAQAGQIVLIRGASGVGKTTLLDCLTGFATPDEGKALWQAENFLHQLPHQRPLSLLQQGDNLFPHLSLLENVCLASNPKWFIAKDVKDQAAQILAEVGLQAEIHQRPEQVSGGQAQRAGLARALLRHQFSPRPILLLDEPYSALDDDNATEMHRLVESLAQKHRLCVLLVAHREVTHDQRWMLEKVGDVVSIRF